jgi:acyl-CoA thioesterase-1
VEKKVVCLGDSLTYGYPYGSHVSWVRYVADRLPIQMINSGVNGNIMEDMYNRYQRGVLRYHPDLLVVLGGTNDAFSMEISCAETIYYLEEIIKKAQADEICPVVALPMLVLDYYPADKLERIRTDERELAVRYNLRCIDFARAFADPQGKVRDELYLDCVHPNIAGYEAMGELALGFFQGIFQR